MQRKPYGLRGLSADNDIGAGDRQICAIGFNERFDLAADHADGLSAAFAGTKTRFCLISFSSDWLYPTAESRAIARALNGAGANVSFVEIASDKGHDAFLLDEPDFHRALRGFLTGCADHAGIAP